MEHNALISFSHLTRVNLKTLNIKNPDPVSGANVSSGSSAVLELNPAAVYHDNCLT